MRLVSVNHLKDGGRIGICETAACRSFRRNCGIARRVPGCLPTIYLL